MPSAGFEHLSLGSVRATVHGGQLDIAKLVNSDMPSSNYNKKDNIVTAVDYMSYIGCVMQECGHK